MYELAMEVKKIFIDKIKPLKLEDLKMTSSIESSIPTTTNG